MPAASASPAAPASGAAPASDAASASPAGAAVTAEGLALRGPRGWVYRDVDFTAPPGTLIAVEGAAGSGRTSLLLTLAGRMRPTSGRAEVGGLPLPRKAAQVRKIAALGPVPGVNDLEGALTVAEHLRERRLLHAFPGGRGRNRRTPAEALALAGLAPDELPAGARTPVRELDALQALRLATALALLGRPRLLCVDDTDDRLHSDDRAAAWRMLHAVAAAGTTVLAATTDAGAAAGLPALTVRLPQPGSAPEAPQPGPSEPRAGTPEPAAPAGPGTAPVRPSGRSTSGPGTSGPGTDAAAPAPVRPAGTADGTTGAAPGGTAAAGAAGLPAAGGAADKTTDLPEKADDARS